LGEILDAGDELVCKVCGIVAVKEVVEAGEGGAPQAIDFTGQALGGYLGPLEYGHTEKFSRGLACSAANFKYLKLVSDYAGREDSTVYGCLKLIERVCEKLSLPGFVMSQAAVIAKKLFEVKRQRSEVTSAALSAYSIAAACKIEDVTSASIKEIVKAHRLLGKRVKISALIRLSIDSPLGTRARRAEEYVGRIIARLSSRPDVDHSLKEARVSPTVYFAGLRRAALESLESLGESGRGGHSPCTLAATAVYAGETAISMRESRRRVLTQRQVSESGDVAEYTVREQYGTLFRPAVRSVVLRLGSAIEPSLRPGS